MILSELTFLLERLFQLSVSENSWRFWSFSVCTTFTSRSLFSFNTDSATLATVSWSVATFLVLENELATESQSATSFLVLEEPNFNKVGTVLATECRLLLAPECRGRSKSSKAAIVTSFSGLKLPLLDGRLIGVCYVDAELGLLTCVWSRIGPRARRSTPERSRPRVYSDSSQRFADEVKTERKAENSGTPRSDMILEHTESLKHLEPMLMHWMKNASEKNVRVRTVR